MPVPVGEDYVFVFHVLTPNANSPNPAGPLQVFLTSNGEGKQLTVEPQNINQQWNIQTLPGETPDSPYRTIVPAFSKDIPAVSQDVVEFPDKVSLIKNLQVWSFKEVGESGLYEIRSNLYPGIDGIDPLLGASEDPETKGLKAIIQKIPVIGAPPPRDRPVWRVIPVDLKK